MHNETIHSIRAVTISKTKNKQFTLSAKPKKAKPNVNFHNKIDNNNIQQKKFNNAKHVQNAVTLYILEFMMFIMFLTPILSR